MPIVEQVQPFESKFSFIQRPQYSQDDVDKIIQMLYTLIKMVIGEAEDISDLLPMMNGDKNFNTFEESKESSS